VHSSRLPDQTGKVAVITGGSSGSGLETAVALAGAGATVVVCSRNTRKIADAVERIRLRTGKTGVHGLELDLASFASIRSGAAELLSQWPRLDVLINNAGVYLSERQLTAEGFEMTFGINHLGHFLLTGLLLDRLRASAPSRVVNVSSVGHRFARDMNFDDLQSERRYSIQEAYTRSKLANVLFTKELARREAANGVSAFAVHPGNIRSGFGQDGDATGVMGMGLRFARLFMAGPKLGAAASVYVAVTPGLESRSGGYFQRSPIGGYRSVHESTPSKAARDAAAATRLWQVSEQLIAGVENRSR
jgi:NAD(P)-dependent dehydrogenase (short-subunit alcohol dehydrogenase family)